VDVGSTPNSQYQQLLQKQLEMQELVSIAQLTGMSPTLVDDSPDINAFLRSLPRDSASAPCPASAPFGLENGLGAIAFAISQQQAALFRQNLPVPPSPTSPVATTHSPSLGGSPGLTLNLGFPPHRHHEGNGASTTGSMSSSLCRTPDMTPVAASLTQSSPGDQTFGGLTPLHDDDHDVGFVDGLFADDAAGSEVSRAASVGGSSGARSRSSRVLAAIRSRTMRAQLPVKVEPFPNINNILAACVPGFMTMGGTAAEQVFDDGDDGYEEDDEGEADGEDGEDDFDHHHRHQQRFFSSADSFLD
jgi:hypothetical protein